MVAVRKSSWWVYMVQCSDGSFYTGATPSLAKRIEKHGQGLGAKYTRSRLPVQLVYSEIQPDKSAALKREYQLKKMSHNQKKALASQQTQVS